MHSYVSVRILGGPTGMDWQVWVSTGHVSVCIFLGFSVQGACAKGQLNVQLLVDCDYSMTETSWNYWQKKGGPATALQTVLVTSQAKIGKCCTSSSPVQGSGMCLASLPLVPAGDTGTIQHRVQGRMDSCYPGGECDNVVKPGTGSTLFYINTWAMVFPSDHPAEWKSKHKLITGISTVNVALNVDWSAVWHQIGMFTINSWSNTSIYWPIQTNTNPCILIHTAILKTV